ncbi:hypothetical protein L3Q82_009297, partial [Scortum barcoo]
AGGELLTSTGDIIGWWKKYFEDLLNPTDLPSNEEGEAGDFEVDSSITQAEVTEPPGKVYASLGTERRIRPIVEPSDSGGTMRFSSRSWKHWTSSIPSTGCLRVYGSLPNQSTCALWIWRRHSTVSLVVFCGGVLREYGVRGPLLRAVRPEQELGSHCRQGRRESRFGNHRISSLLFADDVVLMASSGQDLQHVLERFAAECEAAGMRISTSKSEAMVLDQKRVACPLRVGERGPASSGGVQVSRGLVHTSEGKMESVRLTGD